MPGPIKGITALQLDVKTLNLTSEILEKALEQGKATRAEIMKVVTAAICRTQEKKFLSLRQNYGC